MNIVSIFLHYVHECIQYVMQIKKKKWKTVVFKINCKKNHDLLTMLETIQE
jgi:hypothetical protein